MAVSQPSSPAQRLAEDAFWRSVPGQAVRSFEQGDEFFSYEEPYLRRDSPPGLGGPAKGTVRTAVLAQIEATGWRLQHCNWVNHPNGTVLGIYLFRRDDGRDHRVTGPAPATPPRSRPVLRLHTE